MTNKAPEMPPPPPPKPLRIVVMGVSGCGKSTVGAALAEALGALYVEGDDLHSPQNIRRMAAGIALGDTERQGWLRRVARRLGGARGDVVVACSALKRCYREQLREAAPEVRFVHLTGAPALIASRLSSRPGHYMPASLLPSQLSALEAPAADEHAITLDIDRTPAVLVADLLRQLGRRGAEGQA